MANTASFHLNLSDNINNMAAVQGGYPEQPPMPGGGRKKRRSKGRKAEGKKARRGKARVSKRRSRSRSRSRTRSRSRSRTRTRSGGGARLSDDLEWLMTDFVRDPANHQLFKGAPSLPKPQIPKPDADDANWLEWQRNYQSTREYQTWLLETAKYYYNNGGKDMKKLFGVGIPGMKKAPSKPSEDLNNKVESFFERAHGMPPSSYPPWSKLIGAMDGGGTYGKYKRGGGNCTAQPGGSGCKGCRRGNCALHSQPGGGNCTAQPGGAGCASHSQPGGGNCTAQPGGGSRRRKATRRVSGKGRGRRTSMLRMKKRMSKRRGSKAKSRSRSRSSSSRRR